MQLSDSGDQIVSADTLKKVCVTNFPNVFDLQSVLLEHTKPLIQFIIMGSSGKVASLSEMEASSGEQDLLISDM